MLALRAGQPIAIYELAEGIWGESEEPLGSGKGIQVHISRIRILLKRGNEQPLATVSGGYRLETDGLSIDTRDFERLLGAGRQQLAAGNARAAAASLDQALTLWRGPALMDLRDFPFAEPFAARYDELRVDAAEERIEAHLALGEEQALLPELHALIADRPYRERLHGQLMLALYRAGQQAAALDAYQAARTRLAVDLGVEPGPELERRHQQILEQADELAAPSAGPSASARPGFVSPPPRRPLPAAPVLIGRDDELRELEELAASERLLTLTGAGGTGKTALALGLLHRLAPRFADGAAFVDLAAVGRADQVLPATAAALGVSQSGGSLANRLAEYLAERRMVVVLDNLEHVLEAVPDLARLVDATSGLLLATSRLPLGLHTEHLVGVPPLPVPAADETPDPTQQPAVRLFLHAAAAAGGQVGASPEELAAISRICRAVDGLPLAIEIAATQTRVEAVPELAAHLAERLAGLRGRARNAPARQRTMEAAIGWSLDRLAADQRRAFSQLAVFAGSFSAAGAAAVLRLSREPTIDLLADLLDASLLTRQPAAAGQARFRMLKPIRAVARAHAEPAGLAETEARHAAFIEAEINRLCPGTTGIQRPEDLFQLRVEHPNLMAALAYLASVDPDRCIRAVNQLVDYWQWTGREIEAKRLADELLAGGNLSHRAACAALVISLVGSFLLGRVDEARTAIKRAVSLASRVSDQATSALVRMHEARFGLWSASQDRARVASRAAVAHARRARDQRLLALCLAIRALCEADSPDAKAWLDEAVRIARAQSMAFTEVWVLAALSVHLLDRDPTMAADIERSVLEIAHRFEAPESAALVANNLGSQLVRSGSIDEARILLLSALRTADRVGHRVWASSIVDTLGEVEMALGRWENALILFSASRAMHDRMGVAGLTPESELRLEAAMIRTAEERLDAELAAEARARGQAMSYREAVGLAFEIHGVRRS